MSSPVVTNSDTDLNGKTLLLAETSASITGGLVPASDAVQVGWVYRKHLQLTDAQIKTLPTTPVTLISAPASGLAVQLVGTVLLSMRASAGAYTNVNATSANITIQMAGAGPWLALGPQNDSTLATPLGRLTTFLGAVNRMTYLVPYAEAIQSGGGAGDWGYIQPVVDGPQTAYVATAVQLAADNNGSGNWTGGNAANTLNVVLYYTLTTVP